MCNLYRHAISTDELREIARELERPIEKKSVQANYEPDFVGADSDGPVIAVEDGELVVRMRRWGFPAIRDGAKPITNIRNLDSSWWQNVNREYVFEAAHRCIIPLASFAEWDRSHKRNAWFEIDAKFPCFAGIWRPWHGERLVEVEGKKRRARRTQDFELYAFLTTEPNDTVAAIHPKAMPAILTEPAEMKQWLEGGGDSLDLQRPLADAMVSLAHGGGN